MKSGLVMHTTLAISIIGTAVLGGVGWGQMETRVDNLERDVVLQGAEQSKIAEIDKKQGVLTEKIESLTREQREFRVDTKRSLRSIIRSLSRSAPRNFEE